jgi:AraC-like DNA-binding protein
MRHRGAKSRPTPLPLVLSGYQASKRLRAYRAHTNHKEAAQTLGMARHAFTMWRRRQGLPPKGRGGPPPLSADQLDERLRRARAAKTPEQAARALGLSTRHTYRLFEWAQEKPPWPDRRRRSH